jgi:subtilase family serine protease
MRDLPDVSLFAGDGVWNRFYVMCWSDKRGGGAPCTGAPSGWAGGGGTSFAWPIMAGIQALVNRKAGGAPGNPDYRYYRLAASEYGASGSPVCNSSSGNSTGAGCIFYNVTQGGNAMNCSGSRNCFGATPAGTAHGHHPAPAPANGELSTSDGSPERAFGAAVGWNFSTGIGTVNAYNLINNWTSEGPAN